MWKYTVQVNGMMCGMCESHVNDAVRKAFPVKKVSSSRSKKERDHSDRRDGTGRGCPAGGHFRHRL